MANHTEKIQNREITEELKESYLDYAMSVIVSRALPDVRDGLKPVHRRILWSMLESGLTHSARFLKSANVIGAVLARYHPHGDAAVYDALVRMAQDFSLRAPLIDGQGNWGSIDGDAAAAYRYCVTGDTLVVTDKGMLPVKEIGGNNNHQEEKISIKILSKNKRTNRASKWFDSGIHPTLKITTRNGYEISGSHNHPLLTLQNHPALGPVFAWKTLKEITEGDIVALDRSENILWPKKNLKLMSYYPVKRYHILPKYMDEDLAFILGAFLSEGFISQKKIEFCNTDERFINEVSVRWARVFPDSKLHLFRRAPSSYGKKPYFRLECWCRDTIAFLNNIGLAPVKSRAKTMPEAVLRSPKSVVAAFLRALYEGDGGTISGEKRFDLFYCSASWELVRRLQILLLRFGIASSRRYDASRGLHTLFVRGKTNLKSFGADIGFYSKRKREKLDDYLALQKKEVSTTDLVPFLTDFIREKVGYDEFVTKHNFDRYSNLRNATATVSAVAKQKAGLDLGRTLDYFLDTHYLFETVLSKEKGTPQSVYSIRVDSDCHSFVANGFINHNTEARLSRIAEELLLDIEKETVDWQPNYDGTKQEPKVLPAKLPNLLLNGTMGIAVGMTTNIPPHNLNEIIDATLLLIDNPKASPEDLSEIVQGPDFPTGGIIYSKKEIAQAYVSGRGPITTRGVAEIIERKNGFNVVITEIPYQVNKAELIIKMAELVQKKRVEGIRDIRDESDREGLRIVIELKNDAIPQKVLNQLYQHTDLQKDFHMNMLALAYGIQPQIMSLKDVLSAYIEHRKIVVRRRTEFDLKKSEERAHILEGLANALAVIDKIIATIKKSEDRDDARKNLIKNFKLTEIQANAILEMRLQTLAALERKKIEDELKEKKKFIGEFQILLKSPSKILKVIKDELAELKNKFGEPRRTKVVVGGLKEFKEEDLIPEEEVVITFSQSGYIKRLPPGSFRLQRRGGKGLIGSEVGEEDFITHFIPARTHDNFLFFTDRGRVFQTKVYEIPQATRTAKGKAIQNFLEIPPEEKVSAIVSYKETSGYLVMLTKKGVIKKTALEEFENVRRSGIIAIKLQKGDMLKWVKLSSGNGHIILTTTQGQAIRFKETDARPMGRNAGGTRAIRLKKDDYASSLDIINKDAQKAHLLVVMANGFGKRTPIAQFRIQRRGGSGIKAAKVTSKTGQIVSAHVINEQQTLFAISAKGQIIKTDLASVRIAGRATQGVKIMSVRQGDKVVGVVCL